MAYSAKQKRLYGRVLSGLNRPGVARFMTLTSGPSSPSDIHRSFRALKERIRRRWAFEYIACRETTNSGLIHIHLVWRGGYIPQAWLSKAWADIHHAPIVWVEQAKKDRRMAAYLAKYLGKEALGRFWSSWNWIYRGWRSSREYLSGLFIRCFGYSRRRLWYSLWEEHLRGRWLKLGNAWIPPPGMEHSLR